MNTSTTFLEGKTCNIICAISSLGSSYSVFTHRSRDVEYVIRSECIKELCDWTRLHTDHFATNEFLRHFGWALNDPVRHN